MKLLVIGATGHTGMQIVDLALARSHEVTAFVRSPKTIQRGDPGLTVVEGDPRSVDQVARQLPGHDAVLSALGVRPPRAFRPHALVEECATSTVAAMAQAGVDRLVLVSAAVLFPGDGMLFSFFRSVLKHIARDLRAAEDIVRGTPLAWTIARPPRLTSGFDASYRAVRDALPANGFSMSFRGVAAFMLDAVERHAHVREIVGLAR